MKIGTNFFISFFELTQWISLLRLKYVIWRLAYWFISASSFFIISFLFNIPRRYNETYRYSSPKSKSRFQLSPFFLRYLISLIIPRSLRSRRSCINFFNFSGFLFIPIQRIFVGLTNEPPNGFFDIFGMVRAEGEAKMYETLEAFA